MLINFTKLENNENKKPINPRDIFMQLPAKDKNYNYPRDVQTEVWKQWFEKRNEKNSIIKMNTGSGKTVVGLTILNSCLNEGIGPAVYVVPDKYLIKQVCDEAKKLGIKAIPSDENNKGEDDYYFKNEKAILVTNIYKLVNGKSVFGMNNNKNVKIGSVLIDDVHACLDTIEKQYSISIKSDNPLYKEILNIFDSYKEVHEHQNFIDIKDSLHPRYNYLIPFWVWQKESSKIYSMIKSEKNADKGLASFNLPLMQDNWITANCVLSVHKIEITLKGIPINKITSFENAKRRVFMSATLADDSVFVSTLGLKTEEIKNVITPEKADDIGERLILFPKFLNHKIEDSDIKGILLNYSKKFNVVVIVPSYERLNKFWKPDEIRDVNTQILSVKNNNIESGINKLKTGEFLGLTIMVNKYDGIDLPNEACRILVIDGIPNNRSEYDSLAYECDFNTNKYIREQIQKIEQGMGRGIRSNNDYCGIVLMGEKVLEVFRNRKNKDYFSIATLKQFELSEKLWEQLMNVYETPSCNQVFELFDYILKRNSEWISLCKSKLLDISYDKNQNVDSLIIAMREAFEKESLQKYDEAFMILEEEKNRTNDKYLKGYLMQRMAEYKNFVNPVHAQELLVTAKNLNAYVHSPLQGIQPQKMSLRYDDTQSMNIIKYLNNKQLKGNEFVIYVKELLNNLKFTEAPAKNFEKTLCEAFEMLGIKSSRPELEYGGKAPDNLAAISDNSFVIIECKSRAVTNEISKDDCGQLLQSVQWFKNLYKNERYTPVLIHPSNKFHQHASPSPDMRIITKEKLMKFTNAICDFVENLMNSKVLTNSAEIDKLLKFYKLKDTQILHEYTTGFTQIKQ